MLTPIQPNANPRGRYSIGDTCKLLGIHRNTLRNYTEQGLIKSRLRQNGKRSFYLGSEILRFWEVNT